MQGLLEPIARWWRNWTSARDNVASLRVCGAGEAERFARDVGLSGREFEVLASKWPSAADLLSRRLAALGLDPADIRRIEPQVLPDMQRVCTMCGSGHECVRDLDRDPSDPVWRQYCPNVMTLDALLAERAAPKRAG